MPRCATPIVISANAVDAFDLYISDGSGFGFGQLVMSRTSSQYMAHDTITLQKCRTYKLTVIASKYLSTSPGGLIYRLYQHEDLSCEDCLSFPSPPSPSPCTRVCPPNYTLN